MCRLELRCDTNSSNRFIDRTALNAFPLTRSSTARSVSSPPFPFVIRTNAFLTTTNCVLFFQLHLCVPEAHNEQGNNASNQHISHLIPFIFERRFNQETQEYIESRTSMGHRGIYRVISFCLLTDRFPFKQFIDFVF